MIKILFLAANPTGTRSLHLDEECRAIDAGLRMGEYRDKFSLSSHWAVRTSDIQEVLLRHRPHVVHFSGHGTTTNEIILHDARGNPALVTTRALERLLSILEDNIRCVVLNACFTLPQAEAIAKHIDCVVGTSREIEDSSAAKFAEAFYRALGYGRDVRTAFDLARHQLEMEYKVGHDVPQLVARKCDPRHVFLVMP